MSRYTIAADDPRSVVVVGWDNPLATFFGQVFDTAADDEDEACILWQGDAFRAIPAVEDLQEQIAHVATIPADIVARLIRDRERAEPRSPFQEWALDLFNPDRT